MNYGSNHRNRNCRGIGWALCFGIATLFPTSAHAGFIANVSCCDTQSTPSVPQNNDIEARYKIIQNREKAVSVMMALGYSKSDAQAFINVLMLAGVIL